MAAPGELARQIQSGERLYVPDVLADRYASTPMVNLWSPVGKTMLQRGLWVAILRGQQKLGIDIPDEAIRSYSQAIGQVDLADIRIRERTSQHDVNANINAFNDLAGFQLIHQGMTSRDNTDLVEQFQIRKGLELVRFYSVAALSRFAKRALEYESLAVAERTHNVPAQIITLGKRIANSGEVLLYWYQRLEELLNHYPLRGLKGATGTQADMLQLFDGNQEKVDQLEKMVARALGFRNVLNSVGQVYPRDLDAEVVSTLAHLSAGPGDLSNNIRMMVGTEQATEGFKEGQVGSSAMPYKMNPRLSERIHGYGVTLKGYAVMAQAQADQQLYGGDVADSLARRIFLPGSFFAIDGQLQTTITVLDNFGAYPAVIRREIDRYFPFLTATSIFMAAVKKGRPREDVHEAIKEHSVQVAREMRQQGLDRIDLHERLAGDERIGLSLSEIKHAVGDPLQFAGNASAQTLEFVDKVTQVVAKYPTAANYVPPRIL